MVSGAILVLAGAILVGAGLVGLAVAETANRSFAGGDSAVAAGAVTGLIGLAVLASGFRAHAAGKP
jgi:hypothetical protein